MKGYGDTSYGDAFADVYDDWYEAITDIDATVSFLVALAAESADAPIVELGVGTGRLAIPLAERVQPQEVWGIDTSAAMLSAMSNKPGGGLVHGVHADMVDGLDQVDRSDAPIGLVFAAYNTFF